MQRKRVLKSVVLVVMMSMTLGLGNLASAQAPEDDVFAVVKISNPETLLPAIGALVDKFQPGMGGHDQSHDGGGIWSSIIRNGSAWTRPAITPP